MTQIYDITVKTLRALLVFNTSCLLLNPAVAAEMETKSIKAPVSSVSNIQNLHTSSGGAKAETINKAEQRLPATLKHRDRAVSKEDHKNLSNKSSGITVNTKPHMPTSSMVKQPLKQNNKSTLNKQPNQGMGNYAPIKNEIKARTPAYSPQWSDQGNHDPGVTLLNPMISNDQIGKNTNVKLPSASYPLSEQRNDHTYNLSEQSNDEEFIQFGDGKSGRRLPTTTNSKIPSYKTGNKNPTIDTRHGLNSGMDSVPANNVGMTKTRQNDSENNYLKNSKTTSKQTHTGFKRKPVVDDPSEKKGSK